MNDVDYESDGVVVENNRRMNTHTQDKVFSVFGFGILSQSYCLAITVVYEIVFVGSYLKVGTYKIQSKTGNEFVSRLCSYVGAVIIPSHITYTQNITTMLTQQDANLVTRRRRRRTTTTQQLERASASTTF